MKAIVFVEGAGGDSAANTALRKGFKTLFEKTGLKGRMPEFVPSGNGGSAYEDFVLALSQGKHDYVGLLVDGEEGIVDCEKPWEHLANRKDNPLKRPDAATNDQALIMATCMERGLPPISRCGASLTVAVAYCRTPCPPSREWNGRTATS